MNRRVFRNKFKDDDPTWNRDETSVRIYGRFSVPPCDHVRTRVVEARGTGCETVSVTDSLRLPDRLAQRASSQNDLSIVHTGKKSDKSPISDVYVRFDAELYIGAVEKHRRCLKLVLLLLRRVLSIHPVSFPARHIGCINIATLCIAFA